jgi:hypothetical protein
VVFEKTPIVALSSIEGAKEATWLRVLLKQLGVLQTIIPLYVDNQSCMKIAKNSVYDACTKQIEVHYHYIEKKFCMGK